VDAPTFPKFEPLPMMHSGLSGDLDLLFLQQDQAGDAVAGADGAATA